MLEQMRRRYFVEIARARAYAVFCVIRIVISLHARCERDASPACVFPGIKIKNQIAVCAVTQGTRAEWDFQVVPFAWLITSRIY